MAGGGCSLLPRAKSEILSAKTVQNKVDNFCVVLQSIFATKISGGLLLFYLNAKLFKINKNC